MLIYQKVRLLHDGRIWNICTMVIYRVYVLRNVNQQNMMMYNTYCYYMHNLYKNIIFYNHTSLYMSYINIHKYQ